MRWSDVVPPTTALTFAVLWDPEDDIIAFSSASLLDAGIDAPSTSLNPDSPTDACERCSQVLTIRRPTLSIAENPATLSFFSSEHHDFLFPPPNGLDRFKLGHARISSTLDGLDVYLRGSLFATTHLRDRRYSFLGELANDFDFDPMTSFAHKWMRNGLEGDYLDDDEELEVEFGEEKTGFGEVVSEEKFNLSSAFSVTTTSTSNYIDVEMSDSHDENSESWSTLEAPNTPGFSRLLFREERHSAGLLRKRRPPNNSNNFVTDASPPDSLRSFKRKAIAGFLRNIGLRGLRP